MRQRLLRFLLRGEAWLSLRFEMPTGNSSTTPIRWPTRPPIDFSSFHSEKRKNKLRRSADWAAQELARDLANRTRTENWITGFSNQLASLGGIGTDAAPPDVEITADSRFTINFGSRFAGTRPAILVMPVLLA